MGFEEKGEQARTLFEQGYNCCQSVVGAYAQEMGLDLETAMRLASAFGGGLSRMRETCGTVSGMVMVFGMLQGYSSPRDLGEKTRTYTLTQELVKTFQARNGSLICRELLGLSGGSSAASPASDEPLLSDGSSRPVPEQRSAAYYKRRPCARLVEYAAGLLGEKLTELSAAQQK